MSFQIPITSRQTLIFYLQRGWVLVRYQGHYLIDKDSRSYVVEGQIAGQLIERADLKAHTDAETRQHADVEKWRMRGS